MGGRVINGRWEKNLHKTYQHGNTCFLPCACWQGGAAFGVAVVAAGEDCGRHGEVAVLLLYVVVSV